MFSIFKRSSHAAQPAALPAPLPLPQYWINNYQVSSSSTQDIHPIKRDKSRASMTAKERSNLWLRFQNLNLTDYRYQNETTFIRGELRDGATPIPRDTVSVQSPHSGARNPMPAPRPESVIYDIPRARPIPCHYDIPRAIAIPSHYDIPRAIAIPVTRNIDSLR